MPSKGKSKTEEFQEEDDVVQAVILADSFNSRFKPLSTLKPRTLLPLCNIPLLDWTLESLVSSGVQQIFVYCCSHAEQIKEAINASRWSLPSSGVKILPIVTPEARSIGDVMRELDLKQLITSDFILVTGDIVNTISIMDVLDEHKKRRKVSKDCIMTMVVKPAGPRDRPRRGVDTPVMLLDSNTLECLHYEFARAGQTSLPLPRGKIASRSDLDVRADLIDCSIDVCSVDVPALFTENFDYQDLRADFVHGVLTSDILGKTIYCHIPRHGYAARVKDTRTYSMITHDVLSRRTFPLVPDDTPAYQHRRNYTYLANSSLLSRTCSLGKYTQVGPRSRIKDDVFLDRTVIGEDCIIGRGSVIKNSCIWGGTVIGDGCLIQDSIIANGVKIGPNCTVEGGCLIGEGTVLGTNARLPRGSRVAPVSPSGEDWGDDDNEIEEAGLVTNVQIVGTGAGKVYFWPGPNEEADGDSEGERETSRSRMLNSLGTRACDIDEVDETSVASSTPVSTPSTSPLSASTISYDSDDVPDLSLDGPISSSSLSRKTADFRLECTQSLERAFEEDHTVQNAAIELKTLRMASNVPLSDVKAVVVAFLVSKVPLLGDVASQKKAVTNMVARWGGLLSSIGAEDPVESIRLLQAFCAESPARFALFAPSLQAFYTEDVVEDDDIKAWVLDPRSKQAAGTLGRQCWEIGLRLYRALQETEDSDEEESE